MSPKPQKPDLDPLNDLFADEPMPGQPPSPPQTSAQWKRGILPKPDKKKDKNLARGAQVGTENAYINIVDNIDSRLVVKRDDNQGEQGKEPQKGKGETNICNYDNNFVNPNAPMTDRELNFIEIMAEGKVKTDKGIDLAGYNQCTLRNKYDIAKKIRLKYESQEHGPKKIFRDIGMGEVMVATGIRAMATQNKNMTVKLRAHELAGKALELWSEKQGSEGVTVIIQASDGSPTQVNIQSGPPEAPPQPTSYEHPQPGAPGQPVVITK